MERTLTESVEDYLQDIFLLSLDRKIVRLKDIAKKRGVKMPSVVNAIRVLSENKLVEHEKYGYVMLTDAGVEIAKRIYERHETIYRFLHDVLGVKEEIAEEDAHKMEHDLHNETLESLARFTMLVEQHSDIFNSNHNKSTKGEGYMTLGKLKKGDEAEIIKVNGTGSLKTRLLDMGAVPGTRVRVERVAPLGDPIEISIKGYHLSLRKAEADQIIVKEL